MIYVIYFSDLGTPKTGLSPTIDIFIKVSDGSSAGTPPTITELSGGFYKFTYAPTEDVCIRVDSENLTMADRDRYIVCVASPYDAGLENITGDVTTVKKIQTNKWKITNNQLIIYDDDGVTPLKTFNLSGESTTPYSERTPT